RPSGRPQSNGGVPRLACKPCGPPRSTACKQAVAQDPSTQPWRSTWYSLSTARPTRQAGRASWGGHGGANGCSVFSFLSPAGGKGTEGCAAPSRYRARPRRVVPSGRPRPPNDLAPCANDPRLVGALRAPVARVLCDTPAVAPLRSAGPDRGTDV